jgi:hypothetical protein
MDAPSNLNLNVKPGAPKCTGCGSVPHAVQTILDSRTGKRIRLYQCECGERVWDD